jgi:hypothetical protein
MDKINQTCHKRISFLFCDGPLLDLETKKARSSILQAFFYPQNKFTSSFHRKIQTAIIFGKKTDFSGFKCLSTDGLYALIRSGGFQVFDGDLFLFISANRKRAKVLFWDGSGLNILMKRMEKHLFSKLIDMKEMSVSELNLFMQGARLQSQIMIPKKQSYDA